MTGDNVFVENISINLVHWRVSYLHNIDSTGYAYNMHVNKYSENIVEIIEWFKLVHLAAENRLYLCHIILIWAAFPSIGNRKFNTWI